MLAVQEHRLLSTGTVDIADSWQTMARATDFFEGEIFLVGSCYEKTPFCRDQIPPYYRRSPVPNIYDNYNILKVKDTTVTR